MLLHWKNTKEISYLQESTTIGKLRNISARLKNRKCKQYKNILAHHVSIQLRNDFTEKETYMVGYFYTARYTTDSTQEKSRVPLCRLCGQFSVMQFELLQLCCVQTVRLRIQIPNPYKIAFNSFTVLVRISSSVALQSSSRRWSSESAVDTE